MIKKKKWCLDKKGDNKTKTNAWIASGIAIAVSENDRITDNRFMKASLKKGFN